MLTEMAEKSNLADHYIVQLEKPLKSFHSHHWFHMSEFYLPQSLSKNSAIKYPSRNKAIIIPPTSRFLTQLTKASFFFLILSLPFKALKQILLVDPKFISLCEFTFDYCLNMDTAQPHVWIYNPLLEESHQFRFIARPLFPVTSSLNLHTTGTDNSSMLSYKRLSKLYFNSKDITYATGRYPQSVHTWFNDTAHSDIIRERILSYCHHTSFKRLMESQPNIIKLWNITTAAIPMKHSIESASHTLTMDTHPTMYRLVIYQRDRSRRILHLQLVISQILTELSESHYHSTTALVLSVYNIRY